MPTTKHWTTEPDGEVNIKVHQIVNLLPYCICGRIVSQTTLSGPASVAPITVNSLFKKTALKFPDHPAMRVKRNNEWRVWTWKNFYSDVAKAAKSLIKLGLEPYHGVCILGFNSPEWFMSLLSAIMVKIRIVLCATFQVIFYQRNSESTHMQLTGLCKILKLKEKHCSLFG